MLAFFSLFHPLSKIQKSSSLSRVSIMFSSSQFDGGAYGGFMSSQLSQLPDSTPSPAKLQNREGLVPVTVKQISQASQSGDEKSNFVINGVDVTNVTVVGMVFDKVEKKSDVSFMLDDGTGRISCKRWVNESFDTAEMESIQDEMYVRVNGLLKTFQDGKQLFAFSVRAVKNFDEVTFHFINCIHSHLQYSKVQGGALTQPHMTEASMSTPVRGGSNGSQAVSSNQFTKPYGIDGLKDCDQLVLQCLQQSSDMSQERGMHVDEISRQLKLPIEKIKEAITSLEDEGLVYSTIDEFHYKAA